MHKVSVITWNFQWFSLLQWWYWGMKLNIIIYTCIYICAVVCQELPPLTNGRIEYSPDTTAPYQEGTNAEHICNPGFALIGNVTRVCQNDTLVFSGMPPMCEGTLYYWEQYKNTTQALYSFLRDPCFHCLYAKYIYRQSKQLASIFS